MHLKFSCMGSKGDEYSDESCHVTATTQNSVNGDGVLPFNNGACDSIQLHVSEASNLFSVNSCHDSLFENVESKANIKSSDVAYGGGDQLSLQVNLDQKNVSNDNDLPKIVEGHDDSLSCVSRANDPSAAVSHYKMNVDSKNVSCSSSLGSNLGQERLGKAILLFPKSESFEMPSNNTNAGSTSPKAQTKCLSSLIKGQLSEEDTKFDTSKVSSQLQLHKNLEIGSRTDAECQADGGSIYSNQVDKDRKSNLSVDLPDTQEPALLSLSEDDSDESEIMEHDVKVCDICGDAGREDLLAICSKCSDGAEHTYCMQEMLQKVPEGDWLCEECKLAEVTVKQKQGSDAERKNKARQSSTKGTSEALDMAPVSKRPAVETSFGSPKLSSPTKSPSLSRDSSFKGLDKGKVKLAYQTSFSNHTGFDSAETARSSSIASRLQQSKSLGALMKSSSFNTINSKPKLKYVDEVPQKLRSCRDLDKEGSARMISKSKSFRSVSYVHTSATKSEVKMLSPKFSQFQDMKGLKQVKERAAIESNSLSKLDRPLGSLVTISSSAPVHKVNQKLTPHGECAMTSSISNSKESNALQSDGKSGSLLISNYIIGRKGAENPVTTVRSVEQKSNQVTPKDEPSSCLSWTDERPSNNLDENLQDGSSWSQESSCQSEKIRERPDTSPKPTVTAGMKNLTCHKCKETGHTADLCAIVCPQASVISASRVIKEEMSKGSRLKAAIEAAILKKPGIFRKKKESDQLDGLSLSALDEISGLASNDKFSSLNKTRNFDSDEGPKEGTDLGTCSLENSNQIGKHANVHSGESNLPSKAWDMGSTVKSTHAMEAAPFFSKKLTIPEHECIWQGAFEIRRGGKVFDLYGGVQAHVSTCASPKVLEVVNQFPHKISLVEVPRLSTWPRQFHDNGPKEYNVALYFFAKDLESYEKSYKNLLDNMIKRDLALKGSFDGVDFLIFASTQLPENSKRWNMLFFLWGVFWGRRSSCPLKNSVVPSFHNPPFDMKTLDEINTSLIGDANSKVSNSETNSEMENGRIDYITLSKSVAGNPFFSSEIRCPGTSQEEAALPSYDLDMEKSPYIQATEASIGEDKMVDRMEVDNNEAVTGRNLNNNRKRPLLDLEKAVDFPDDTSQRTTGNDKTVDDGSLNKKLKSEKYERENPNVGASERYFSVDSPNVNDIPMGGSLMPWKENSSNDEHQIQEKVPNLELSLSYPFPDEEQNVKPVIKTEQFRSERYNVNTSLLHFGGFSDK